MKQENAHTKILVLYILRERNFFWKYLIIFNTYKIVNMEATINWLMQIVFIFINICILLFLFKIIKNVCSVFC